MPDNARDNCRPMGSSGLPSSTTHDFLKAPMHPVRPGRRGCHRFDSSRIIWRYKGSCCGSGDIDPGPSPRLRLHPPPRTYPACACAGITVSGSILHRCKHARQRTAGRF